MVTTANSSCMDTASVMLPYHLLCLLYIDLAGLRNYLPVISVCRMSGQIIEIKLPKWMFCVLEKFHAQSTLGRTVFRSLKKHLTDYIDFITIICIHI